MADPLQIENMDAQQIAERHVIERYLAGQLTDQEAMAFEAYVEAHPEITRDIEEIARMKTGLVRLKDRGDLPSVVVPRGNWISRRTGLVAALLLSCDATSSRHFATGPSCPPSMENSSGQRVGTCLVPPLQWSRLWLGGGKERRGQHMRATP